MQSVPEHLCTKINYFNITPHGEKFKKELNCHKLKDIYNQWLV